MAYTLESFCNDVRVALKDDKGNGGREQVRVLLEKLLKNKEFIESAVGPGVKHGIHTLYQDKELGFCVLAHVYENGTTSPPHDHGKSWAVYGEATEYTDMMLWKRLDDGTKEPHAEVQPTSVYRLNVGEVGVFHPGDIHSIQFPDGARFIRITGTDLNTEAQARYNVKNRTVAVDAPMAHAR
jgi:predicted metal-dependent enzyme (double-stranded beta helix superfamily)